MKTYLVRFINHDEMYECTCIKQLKRLIMVEYSMDDVWMIAEVKYENYEVLDNYEQ